MANARWSVPAALLLMVMASALSAQSGPTTFTALSGEWTGEGTLFDRPARFTMQWREQDGFATLHFSNAFVEAAGDLTPVLRAAAAYRTDPASPEGVWLDSRGVRMELLWEASDSSLVVTWTAPTESGRTTYSVRPSGELDVVDEVRSGDAWRTFATAVLRKEAS